MEDCLLARAKRMPPSTRPLEEAPAFTETLRSSERVVWIEPGASSKRPSWIFAAYEPSEADLAGA